MHTLAEFVEILSIPKLIGKYTITKYASSLSGERSDRAGDCVGGGIPLPTPGSFWILRIQSERSAYFWWICWNIVYPNIHRKIHVHRICVFLTSRMTNEQAKRPSGGGCGRGYPPPTHITNPSRNFCTFDEYVGILSILFLQKCHV